MPLELVVRYWFCACVCFSMGTAATTRAGLEEQQQQWRERAAEAKSRTLAAFAAASSAAAAERRERRAAYVEALQRKEWEDERELLTCTAIDLEIKRVAAWSAVYLQDNKAAANPCRASAAAAAAAERSRRELEASASGYSSAVASAAAVAVAEAESRETDGESEDKGKSWSGTYLSPAHRTRISVGTRRLSPPAMQLPAVDASVDSGTNNNASKSDASKPSLPSTAVTGQEANGRRTNRAAQEVQHLTCLLGEVWAEDWLSVSLPSPPPFSGYFRAQEGRVLLLPVLLRASTKNERGALQRRLEEGQRVVDSVTPSNRKGRPASEAQPATHRVVVVHRERGSAAPGQHMAGCCCWCYCFALHSSSFGFTATAMGECACSLLWFACVCRGEARMHFSFRRADDEGASWRESSNNSSSKSRNGRNGIPFGHARGEEEVRCC